MSTGRNTKGMSHKQSEIEATAEIIHNGMSLTHPLPVKPQQGQLTRYVQQQCQRRSIEYSFRNPENGRIICYQPPMHLDFPSSQLISSRKRNEDAYIPFNLPSIPAGSGISESWEPQGYREKVETSCDPAVRELGQLRQILYDAKCHASPFTPRTVEELRLHKCWYLGRVARKIEKIRLVEQHGVNFPKVTTSCMGGKVFGSNHSAVLACKTMWCPETWPDYQKPVNWPSETELIIEGWDRHKNGYGRYFPVPRTEEFEWRLATRDWLINPVKVKYPIWDGIGPVPIQERRFARVRGELDCIVGSGRWVDEELIFDRAEETAKEDEAGIVGAALWKIIEEEGEEEVEKERKFSLEEKAL